MAKHHEFPNGLGYSIKVAKGYWDLWRPDRERPYWRATFFPKNAKLESVTGVGHTPDFAQASARTKL